MIIVIILLVLLLIVGTVTWHYQNSKHAKARQQAYIDPPATDQPAAFDDPGFVIQLGPPPRSADPGFTVISVTEPHKPVFPPAQQNFFASAASPPAADFTLVEVVANPTAICKLTGKQVGKCTCERHKGKKK